MEIWKKVLWVNGELVNTHKDYFISNLGNIKRADKYLKPYPNPDGYLTVSVFIKDENGNTIRKVSAIHRLVAVHFIPNPNNLPEVNHLNGDKTKNDEFSLEWCTRKYNVNHAFAIGLAKPKVGMDHYYAKLNDDLVHEICSMISKGFSNIKISRNFDNVSVSDVSNIKRRQNWTHISDHYEFNNTLEAEDRPYTKKDIEYVCTLIHAGYTNTLILRTVPNIKKAGAPNRLLNRIRSGENYRKEYSEVQRLSKPGIWE